MRKGYVEGTSRVRRGVEPLQSSTLYATGSPSHCLCVKVRRGLRRGYVEGTSRVRRGCVEARAQQTTHQISYRCATVFTSPPWLRTEVCWLLSIASLEAMSLFCRSLVMGLALGKGSHIHVSALARSIRRIRGCFTIINTRP